MHIGPTPDDARHRPRWSGYRRSRAQAAGAGAALLLAVTACGADNSAAPTDADTPPLEEPTESAERDPSGHDQTESDQDEAAEDEPTENDDDAQQRGESEAIDVSEFSSQSQESTGFPEMLTEFPEDGEELLLAEVRVGKHDGYDRIVFEHTGDGAPGWHAEYVDEAVEPGSGFPLEVEGEAILYLSAVGLEPGNAAAEQGHLEITDWSEPQDTVFQDVRTTIVHHGAASYYVGLDQERDFRVSVWEHEDGPRLIIDVLNQ